MHFLNSILRFPQVGLRDFFLSFRTRLENCCSISDKQEKYWDYCLKDPKGHFLPYFALLVNCWRRITPSALVVGQLYCQMVSWTAVVHILSADQDMPSEAAQICSKYIFSNPIFILVSFTCTIPKASFVRCYLTGWRFKIILTDVFKVLPSM